MNRVDLPKRYASHLDRLAAAVVRLHGGGRNLRKSIDDVAESEALTPLGLSRLTEKVYQLLGLGPVPTPPPVQAGEGIQ